MKGVSARGNEVAAKYPATAAAFTVPVEEIPPVATDATGHHPRVLVADDNAINRKLIAKMLAKLGLESVMAANGAEAVEACDREDFVAILMDIQMPEMDGIEATRQLRKRGCKTPIIAITADAMPDDQ